MLEKKKWSQKEDGILFDALKIFNTDLKKWKNISNYFEFKFNIIKSNNQCRQRYDYLCKIYNNKDDWDTNSDIKLIKNQLLFKNDWNKIKNIFKNYLICYLKNKFLDILIKVILILKKSHRKIKFKKIDKNLLYKFYKIQFDNNINDIDKKYIIQSRNWNKLLKDYVNVIYLKIKKINFLKYKDLIPTIFEYKFLDINKIFNNNEASSINIDYLELKENKDLIENSKFKDNTNISVFLENISNDSFGIIENLENNNYEKDYFEYL